MLMGQLVFLLRLCWELCWQILSLSGYRAETSALTLMRILLRVCWVCWVSYCESGEDSVGDYAESLLGILLRLPAPYLLDLSPGFCKDCSWDC